jgi:cytochrome oxidase Cu insertion factor (SCO1/SenC/PrrC family)
MKSIARLREIMVLSAVGLAACAPQPAAMPEAEIPQETPMAEPMTGRETPAADAMVEEVSPTEEAAMDSGSEAAMPMAEWLATPMTNVVTGQEFRVSDYQGKVVLVETMAVWCSKCRTQQEQIRILHEQLGAQATDLVSITLDIDPNEDAQYLKAFVSQTGFDWIYAVAPAELSRALAAAYGDQFLNPPSTPILILDRHGVAHPLPFGIKSAADLQAAVQPYLDGST